MIRRIIALMLVVALWAVVLPTVSAESKEKGAKIEAKIRADYQNALAASGKDDLGGYCGLMTSWQLYFMGINQYVIMADGNKQYDTYCNMDSTNGGYAVHAYSAEDYTLRQALNLISKNGTRDVHNVLVGFEKTSTEAGAKYGHSVVIYAIIDGMVYFTEGFQTSFFNAAGAPIKITIDQFAEYYAGWMEYEGLIVFEEKTYRHGCTRFPANIFVEVIIPAELLTEPCSEDYKPIRSKLCRIAAAGERLWVTGLYRNPLGQYYYQVVDSGEVCYVSADDTQFLQVNSGEEVIYLPNASQTKSGWHPTGTLISSYSAMRALRMEIRNDHGRSVGSYALIGKTDIYRLDSDEIQKLISDCPADLSSRCTISVDLYNCYIKDGILCSDTQTIPVQQMPIPTVADTSVGNTNPFVHADGWTYENAHWYYYRNGKPVTGWLTHKNVEYYLDETGAAATGWRNIEGKCAFLQIQGHFGVLNGADVN